MYSQKQFPNNDFILINNPLGNEKGVYQNELKYLIEVNDKDSIFTFSYTCPNYHPSTLP